MATITPTFDSNGARQIITWSGMATGDTIVSANTDNRPTRHVTLHLYGTWGGATVTLTGSFDDSNFTIVPDSTGTSISETADVVLSVGTMLRYWKPNISGGSGDSVTAVLALYYSS